MDDDRRQRGLNELCWMVDGVSIQHHQLQRPGQLKDPLDFTLDFRYEEKNHMDLIQPVSSHAGGVNIYCTCTSLTEAGAGVGPLDDGPLAGVVQYRPLGQRYVSCYPCDGYPATKNQTRHPEHGGVRTL